MALSVDHDTLYFEFPDVHTAAELRVTFHRTVRVPDDGREYPLPPSLGTFPVRVVGDRLALPVWQSEACWIKFDCRYPFLVKVGVGDVNAVTGGAWSPEPDFDGEDYFEVPEQPWLDGFCVERGSVRQFVAARLGEGRTVEEQLSESPALGGVRIVAYPLRAEVWEKRRKDREQEPVRMFSVMPAAMGLGAGGAVTQGIATPVEVPGAWDLGQSSTVRVDLLDSARWHDLTGAPPPTEPLTAAEYAARGYPWFELYDEAPARAGSPGLAAVESVSEIAKRKGTPLDDAGVETGEPIRIRRRHV